jgi:hypothetical protein
VLPASSAQKFILRPSAFRVRVLRSCLALSGFPDGPQPLLSRHRNLNRLLRILRTLILCSSVDGGTQSLAAAPDGPATRPRLSATAASIISRSQRGSCGVDADD